MANHCDNYLEISTSALPDTFLTPELDAIWEPIPWKWSFELLERICPFNDPSGKDPFPFWWTRWIDVHELTLEEHTQAPPPEPEPIMITQGTRRYPLYTWPKKKPYKYTTYKITFTSAWAPPINYLDRLYQILKMVDDRTEMHIQYYEPGCWVLGEWQNGHENNYDAPDTYYSDILWEDIMNSGENPPDAWLAFNDPANYLTPTDAIDQLKALGTPEATEQAEEIKSHFCLD